MWSTKIGMVLGGTHGLGWRDFKQEEKDDIFILC